MCVETVCRQGESFTSRKVMGRKILNAWSLSMSRGSSLTKAARAAKAEDRPSSYAKEQLAIICFINPVIRFSPRGYVVMKVTTMLAEASRMPFRCDRGICSVSLSIKS